MQKRSERNIRSTRTHGGGHGARTATVPIVLTVLLLVMLLWASAASGLFGESVSTWTRAFWSGGGRVNGDGAVDGLPDGAADTAAGGGSGEASGNASISETLVPLTDDVEILELLMRQNADELPWLGGRLPELMLREDATGYHANLYQAMLLTQSTQRTDENEADGEPADALRAALALHEDAAVRRLLADTLLRKGDTTGALAEYAVLLPNAEAYAQVLALQTNPEEICNLLLAKSMFAEALAYVAETRERTNTPDALLKLDICVALATARAGNLSDALPLFEALPVASREPGAAPEGNAASASVLTPAWNSPENVAWWHARCMEQVGRTEDAISIYDRLGAPGGERLGALLEKQGDISAAADAYLSAPSANARWEGVRLAEQAGLEDKAISACLKLAVENERVSDDAAYRGYRLLLQKNRGSETEARSVETEAFLRVLSEYPSWMDRIDMKMSWPATTPGTPVRPAWVDRYEKFESAGLKAAASLELEICTRVTTPSEKLGLAKWRLSRGERYESVVWGMRALKEEKSVLAYQLAYPRPFTEQVDASAAEFDVDPLLIWSVMRTESTYRPDVLSRSGAIGLMQIMPATGQDIASRLKTTVTDADLKNPDINVRFGAYYIGSMLKSFNGNRDQAMAAYNGGPGNVRKWLKNPLVKQEEDFPSFIRFEESREYITKVMEAWHWYRWMETDERFATP